MKQVPGAIGVVPPPALTLLFLDQTSKNIRLLGLQSSIIVQSLNSNG